MRSASRVVGASITTVGKLVVSAGQACNEYHDQHVVNVPAQRVQCDETWAFCYAKKANVLEAVKAPAEAGDVWTWIAIDEDTKLVLSWYVGGRDAESGIEFMTDLKSRLARPVELTTDQLAAYPIAVEAVFGSDVDFRQLTRTGPGPRPYTAHVERHNLTMRMSIKRFTRKTNAFSKKLENHWHALALYFMFYNWCRPHQTLTRRHRYDVTPAMAAGLAQSVHDVNWIVGEIDDRATRLRGSN